MKEITISTPYIKLDQLIKFAGIVGSGSDAKAMVINEMILLNGQVEVQRGKKIKNGDIVEIKGGITIKVIGG